MYILQGKMNFKDVVFFTQRDFKDCLSYDVLSSSSRVIFITYTPYEHIIETSRLGSRRTHSV